MFSSTSFFLLFIAVTKELTDGLEMAAKIESKSDDTSKESGEQNLDLSAVILRCTKLYPELFNPTVENTR